MLCVQGQLEEALLHVIALAHRLKKAVPSAAICREKREWLSKVFFDKGSAKVKYLNFKLCWMKQVTLANQ